MGIDASDCKNPKGKALYGDDKNRIIANISASAGEPTFAHELGHCKFLNHTYASQRVSDPLQLHHAGASCTMTATGVNDLMRFCGLCRLRMRGWSIFKVTDARAGTWDDQTKVMNPDGASEGPIPAPQQQQ
jgi:hypothetical protein